MTNTDHESYLRPFFDAMNVDFKDRWCVLHSYESLPYFSLSDVDMAFSGNDISKLEQLIRNVATKSGWQLYQKLWYDVKKCFYYVLKKNDENVFLAIDFLIDNDGIGKYGFKTSVLTQNCNWHQELIPIPNHEVACCYKLIKRIVKKRPLEEDASYIRAHYKLSNPDKIEQILLEHFNPTDVNLLIRFLLKQKDNLTETEIIQLHNSRNKLISSISSSIKHSFWEASRIFKRITAPSGLIVYIPDFEPKKQQQFTEQLSEKLSILFRFVSLQPSSSRFTNFKALIGSTLLICPKHNFNPKKVVNRSLLYPKLSEVKIQKNSMHEQPIEQWVDSYYTAILSKLHKRFI